MRRISASLIFLAFLAIPPISIYGQAVEKIRIPELEKILNMPGDKLYVVNFWATWCAPCIKEFPVFEKISGEFNKNEVEFIMISLDFPGDLESKLIPFLKKNQTSLNVKVMMDVDYNAWIDKVDKSWQGQIPATLIFNNDKKQRYFKSGEVDDSGLRNVIKKYL